MKINTKNYAIALYQLLKETKGEEFKKVTQNFVNLLAKKRLLSLAPKILADFNNYYNQAEGVIEAKAETAQALSETEIKNLSRRLEKLAGKKIELKNKVNKDLIGGIKLYFADTLIDGSLLARLNSLHKKLTN